MAAKKTKKAQRPPAGEKRTVHVDSHVKRDGAQVDGYTQVRHAGRGRPRLRPTWAGARMSAQDSRRHWGTRKKASVALGGASAIEGLLVVSGQALAALVTAVVMLTVALCWSAWHVKKSRRRATGRQFRKARRRTWKRLIGRAKRPFQRRARHDRWEVRATQVRVRPGRPGDASRSQAKDRARAYARAHGGGRWA